MIFVLHNYFGIDFQAVGNFWGSVVTLPQTALTLAPGYASFYTAPHRPNSGPWLC